MLAETLPASVQPPGLQAAQQPSPGTVDAPWQDRERRQAALSSDWGLGGGPPTLPVFISGLPLLSLSLHSPHFLPPFP